MAFFCFMVRDSFSCSCSFAQDLFTIICPNLGAGSSLCGIFLLAVLTHRLCCKVANMQADDHQSGEEHGERENKTKVEAGSKPSSSLLPYLMTESRSLDVLPTLLDDEWGEGTKEFRAVVELECLLPNCTECDKIGDEVFWNWTSKCSIFFRKNSALFPQRSKK